MIYFLVIIVLLIQIYIYDFHKSKRNRKLNYNIVLVSLILIAGLRYRVGLDTIRYMNTFTLVPTISNVTFVKMNESSSDPLYFLLSVLAKTISSNFVIMQFLQSIIVNCSVFYFVRKHTQYIFSAIFFYFLFLYFNFNFEVMREAVAVSFFLISFDYLVTKRYIKYYFFVTLAFLSHSSAIILFLVPLFMNLRIDKNLIIYLSLAIVLIIILSSQLDKLMTMILYNGSIAVKLENYYLASNLLSGDSLNLNGMLRYILMYIIYPLLCFIILRKIDISFKCNYQFAILIVMIIAIFLWKITLFYRYFNYFFMFDVLLFAELSGRFNVYIKRRISFIPGTFLLSVFFSLLIFFQIYGLVKVPEDSGIADYHRYFPYESVITSQIDPVRERIIYYHHADEY